MAPYVLSQIQIHYVQKQQRCTSFILVSSKCRLAVCQVGKTLAIVNRKHTSSLLQKRTGKNAKRPRMFCLQHIFAQSRSASGPVQTLKVSKDQLVAFEIMYNTINTLVTSNLIHVLVLLVSCSAVTVFVRLGFESGDAEAAGLEDGDDLNDDIMRLAAGLVGGHVGLETGVGALRLGCDVDGKVVGGSRVSSRRNDTIGRETAGSEEVGIYLGLGILGDGVDGGQSASFRDNRAQSVAFGGQFFREGQLLGRVGGSLGKYIDIMVVIMSVLAKVAQVFNGVLASLLRLLQVVSLGNGTGVFEVELAGILLVKIGHENFQRLVLLNMVKLCIVEAIRVVQDLGRSFSLRSGRWRELGVGSGYVQVPVLAVHLSNHIGATSHEHFVEELDLVTPAAVRTALLVRIQKVLATVEDAVRNGGSGNGGRQVGVDGREAGLESSNLEHSWQAVQQGGGAACLEDELVGKDEHAGLGEEVCIHVAVAYDGQNLAVDQIEHLFPRVGRDGLETGRLGRVGQGSSRRAEP
jgi:hypothetical protein